MNINSTMTDKNLEINAARIAEKQLVVKKINEQGYNIKELSDLVDSEDIDYVGLIPYLYDLLSMHYNEWTKSAIVRAIFKYIDSEFHNLANLYKKTKNDDDQSYFKDIIANELVNYAKKNKIHTPVIEDLLLDKNNGKSRIILLDLLKSSKDERHTQLLKKLALDLDLRSNIIFWKSYWMKRDPDLYMEWEEDRRLIKERLRLLLKEEDRLRKEQLKLAGTKK